MTSVKGREILFVSGCDLYFFISCFAASSDNPITTRVWTANSAVVELGLCSRTEL